MPNIGTLIAHSLPVIFSKNVDILPVSRPQTVQVVSIDDVPRRFGSTSFQSKEVKGALKRKTFYILNLSPFQTSITATLLRERQ